MTDKLILGIELGSTRIKSVLIDEKSNVLAQGAFEWQNVLTDGLWSYPMELVEQGLRSSYSSLAAEYKSKFGKDITNLDAIGISAMMHGYLAFDGKDSLLAPFRTWRNTNTEQAAKELSELFEFNIPMRWSVAQYYQSVLDGLDHVKNVKFMTTLAGYVHYKLTGKKVLGIDDASGMFPCDKNNYDKSMLKKFNALLQSKGINIDFESLLPEVLLAGDNAGTLTEDGAKWLDPTGKLKAGALLCPPEGDAGTGMVATNSIMPHTANVSAGTSAFLMAVLSEPLKNVYKEIDVVATPTGDPVAMVHVNNCTSEINAWVDLFGETVELFGGKVSRAELFEKLFNVAADAGANAEKLVAFNMLSGEPIAGLNSGSPMVVRKSDGKLCLPDFMRTQLFSAVATLRIGVEILKNEQVVIDRVCGHGGFFKTPRVGQSVMSAALDAPVTVMQNAGEGGAYGMALLADFALCGKKGENLQDYLDNIFAGAKTSVVSADEALRRGFDEYMVAFKKYLPAEKIISEIA